MDRDISRHETPLDLGFLEKKARVIGKRTFGIVLFGDITRYKAWTNHPFTSVEKRTRFMVRLYDEFLRFRNGSGYFVKLLADGLMAVKELPETQDRKDQILKMLVSASKLVVSVNKLIKQQEYPRPDGFRIRLAAGDLLKLIAQHPTDKTRVQIDYSEYPVDLAHSLLQVRKEIPCICHVSVREQVGRDIPGHSAVEFEPVEETQFCPEGINPQDLKVLSTFRVVN